MKRDLIPAKDSCVILDTNALIFSLGEGHYNTSCAKVLDLMKKAGVDLYTPAIVEYEALRKQQSIKNYYGLWRKIDDNFYHWPITSKILDAACKLQLMYFWNKDTEEFGGRNNITSDMIVAATAGAHAKTFQCPTYILSADQDYLLPYCTQYTYYELEHPKKKANCQHMYLYKVDIEKTNDDWRKYLDVLNSKES